MIVSDYDIKSKNRKARYFANWKSWHIGAGNYLRQYEEKRVKKVKANPEKLLIQHLQGIDGIMQFTAYFNGRNNAIYGFPGKIRMKPEDLDDMIGRLYAYRRYLENPRIVLPRSKLHTRKRFLHVALNDYVDRKTGEHVGEVERLKLLNIKTEKRLQITNKRLLASYAEMLKRIRRWQLANIRARLKVKSKVKA